MPTVKEILENKGPQVITIHPEASVFEAAQRMNEYKIGALVVVDDGRVVGMFSERDILQRVVAPRRDASVASVADVMTSEVVCCQLHTSLDEARGVMKNRRIRHMPILDDDGQLLGLVSIGDLNAYQAHSQEKTIYLLHQYIYGQT